MSCSKSVVLVASDKKLFKSWIETTQEFSPHLQLYHAPNSDAALDLMFGRNPLSHKVIPNLIFLDFDSVSGLDRLIHQVRSQEETQHIPIIILSDKPLLNGELQEPFNSQLLNTSSLATPQSIKAVLNYWLVHNICPFTQEERPLCRALGMTESPWVQEWLCKAMEKTTCRLDLVPNPHEALIMHRYRAYDLTILDLDHESSVDLALRLSKFFPNTVLIGLKGINTEALQSSETNESIKHIVTKGVAWPEFESVLRSAGFTGFDLPMSVKNVA